MSNNILSPQSPGPRFQTERAIAFKTGARIVGPALVAMSIWALVTGIAMAKAGLTKSMALVMSLLVYAGSAQLTALPLIITHTPLWLVFAAGFVVNVRFIVFAAALQPFFRHLTWYKRLALGYFTVDICFALFMKRFGEAKVKNTQEQLWFMLGLMVPAWLSWQVFSILGIYLGSIVPTAWSLEFAAVLALLAITLPLIVSKSMLAAVIAAGVIAVVGQVLPLHLGIAAAVIGGISTGMITERFLKRKR